MTKDMDIKMEVSPLVSIIIVTYNHKKYIDKCLKSVTKQDYSHEIIVVDNNSIDGTAEYIKTNFPQVKVIENSQNKGFGAGNNIGAKHSSGEYLVFLNPDTIVEDNWLKELVTPLFSGSKLITTPKILTYDGSKINTCGLIIHFTGLSFTRGYGDDPNNFDKIESVNGFSGCCFAISNRNFKFLQGFDENFFLYNDDVELSCRAKINGFDIIFIPTSTIRHDYFLNVQPMKLYYLEKGRYLFIRKYFNNKYFFCFFPSLFLVEIITFVYALKLRWNGLKYKLKAIKDGLLTKLKSEPFDGTNLLNIFDTKIPYGQLIYSKVGYIFLNLVNYLLDLNFQIVKTKLVKL